MDRRRTKWTIKTWQTSGRADIVDPVYFIVHYFWMETERVFIHFDLICIYFSTAYTIRIFKTKHYIFKKYLSIQESP